MCECAEGGLLRLKDEAGLRGAQEAYLPGSSPSNRAFGGGAGEEESECGRKGPWEHANGVHCSMKYTNDTFSKRFHTLAYSIHTRPSEVAAGAQWSLSQQGSLATGRAW